MSFYAVQFITIYVENTILDVIGQIEHALNIVFQVKMVLTT